MTTTDRPRTEANESTISELPQLVRTGASQINELFDLRVRSAKVRERSASVAGAAEGIHDQIQSVDLNARAAALAQNDLADLLVMIGDERGLPWSLVAQLVGVSPTAVRKWRKGGEITPERRARLARLIAFCQIVADHEPGFPDVPLWLQSPIISGATTLTPADLFAASDEVDALNLAASRASAEDVLDRVRPDWRSSTKPDTRHRVVEAPDGVMSIVPITEP